MEIKLSEFSRCETCDAELGSIRMDAPLYCISCVEEMERLKMNPMRYGKHKAVGNTFGNE